MPRIPASALRAASTASPNLARLLPACRDLASARNELRWLREHVEGGRREGEDGPGEAPRGARRAAARRLAELCERRGTGVPLQYILGTQPFGDLDVVCGRGVLIPRPETEAYTTHLARLLRTGRLLGGERRRPLGIVDFCTGTGCIPLLLSSLLSRAFPTLHVHGVDISPRALALSRQNLTSALSKSHVPPPSPQQYIAFHHGDLLSAPWLSEALPALIPRCDVLVSNPPYVSPEAWRFGRGELSYSTRKFEPRLALVPRGVDAPQGCRPEDVFYAALLDATAVLEPSVALFEFGDEAQGRRVLDLALGHSFCRGAEFEFWRDCPDLEGPGAEGEDVATAVTVEDPAGVRRVVPIRGSGNIRSILIRKPTSQQPV